jgi:rhamnosyltransferase
MRSKIAVLRVIYKSDLLDRQEIDLATKTFGFYLVVNNTKNKVLNPFPEFYNFDIINNLNVNALSGAYNEGIKYFSDINPEFILFLDEDTPIMQFLYLFDNDLCRPFNDAQVAAVAPNYLDKVSGTRGSHVLLRRFAYKKIHRDSVGIFNVSFFINSGSVWRFICLSKIGKYDDQMQIDHIDTDYCLRAIKIGYKLILNSNFTFEHKIGNRLSYKLFGFNFRSGNHSPHRRWYIMRNSVLLLRKHSIGFPVLLLVIFLRIVYEFIGIMIAEENKASKIFMSLKGLFKGLNESIRKNNI